MLRCNDGIWLRIYKKDSDVKTVTYAQALDEALCYGWIAWRLQTAKKSETRERKVHRQNLYATHRTVR